MTFRGRIHNGVVVLDEPVPWAEGAAVRIELDSTETNKNIPQRVGGLWHGQVHIAPDFDELPEDIAAALGITVR